VLGPLYLLLSNVHVYPTHMQFKHFTRRDEKPQDQVQRAV